MDLFEPYIVIIVPIDGSCRFGRSTCFARHVRVVKASITKRRSILRRKHERIIRQRLFGQKFEKCRAEKRLLVDIIVGHTVSSLDNIIACRRGRIPTSSSALERLDQAAVYRSCIMYSAICEALSSVLGLSVDRANCHVVEVGFCGVDHAHWRGWRLQVAAGDCAFGTTKLG